MRVVVRERTRPYKPGCEALHPQRYPDEPIPYLGWMDWAEKMSKTHRQKFCPHCERWAIWEPKEKNGASRRSARQTTA